MALHGHGARRRHPTLPAQASAKARAAVGKKRRRTIPPFNPRTGTAGLGAVTKTKRRKARR